MVKYQALNKFPLGSIKAEGFLKDQLKIGKEGIGGHLHELEPEMIAAPFIRDYKVPAWEDRHNLGWGAELAANYWRGYIQWAYVLDDPEMKEVAKSWVDGVLKNQLEDGYLGTFCHEGDPIYDDFNGVGSGMLANVLIAYYEATKREDVLTALHRAMLWFCKTWAGDKKTSYAGGLLIEPLIGVYQLTGDKNLLDFCEDYLEYLCKNNLFGQSYKEMLSDVYHYNSNHTTGYALGARFPAKVYTATGKEEYLQAAINHIRKLRNKSVHVTGGPSCVNEYLGPISSIADSEYCSFTHLNLAYSCLGEITGASEYGDYMEEIFYNAAQGARKKDEKAIAYMSAPNQIFATEHSEAQSNLYDEQVYAPCYWVACCPTNAVGIVPDFIGAMYMYDKKENIYVTAYGPSSLKYKDISITQKTLYSFRNSTAFEINCNKSFSLNLRIPQWAKDYEIYVNGEKVTANKNMSGYAEIKRLWNSGDTVKIVFKAGVEVITVDDTDAGAKYPLAIKYGPLTYSYHIPEDWQKTAGRPNTPLPEGWSWYNVYPKYEEADVTDYNIMLGLRRYQFSWNIALDEALSEKDFEIEETEPEGYVWSNPPIKLHTHCYKAPYLTALYPEKTTEPYGKYQYVTDKLPLTLVPYGCTNLRITYFPKADLKNK